MNAKASLMAKPFKVNEVDAAFFESKANKVGFVAKPRKVSIADLTAQPLKAIKTSKAKIVVINLEQLLFRSTEAYNL